MGLLIIMRGLPGSGKSYAVGELLFMHGYIDGMIVRVCSADDYFTDAEGNYKFIQERLPEAHRWCREMCNHHLFNGTDVVIIDNTNTTYKEAKPYVEMGLIYGYDIKVIYPNTPWKNNIEELVRRNTHGVPRETIEKMFTRFEAPEVFTTNFEEHRDSYLFTKERKAC